MAQIAVIGTGVIGGGMAVNLLRNGHQVAVWNRTAEHAAEVVAAGATLAATPADAARGADVVFEATADDVSSRSVWLGDEGIIAGSAESATLVTSATLSPGWVAELAEACRSAARPFLDMPVTGGRAGAESGALDHARRRRRGHPGVDRRCPRRRLVDRPALRSRRQRYAVQVGAQRSPGGPPRRLRRGDGDGPFGRTRSRRGRRGSRRSARRASYDDGLGGARPGSGARQLRARLGR